MIRAALKPFRPLLDTPVSVQHVKDAILCISAGNLKGNNSTIWKGDITLEPIR